MSGFGEHPVEQAEQSRSETPAVTVGETVFNMDGEAVGEVRGIEAGGFFVSTRDGVERLSIHHARAGHEFGEAEIMWRCTVCGEMGEISDGLPPRCPNCASGIEELMYWTED